MEFFDENCIIEQKKNNRVGELTEWMKQMLILEYEKSAFNGFPSSFNQLLMQENVLLLTQKTFVLLTSCTFASLHVNQM